MYCIIIYLSFLNWDWLLIREVQWFYWTQKLLVPVEKFTVRMPKVRLELATPGLQTQCSSHWAIQLKSYCWEGVEFIQLVYCIIIYLSFLNWDWLLIWEAQWFYWTQKLLIPVEKLQWGCRRWGSNSQPLDYKPSALAIELYSSKAIAGKELSLSSWCIASLYICHFLTEIDFSSDLSTGTRSFCVQ